MRKIKYNIASYRKVNQLRYYSVSVLILIVSLLIILLGVHNLKSNNLKLKTEKNKIESYQNKISDISEKSSLYNNEIKKKESKWKRRINFSNLIIRHKNKSYIQDLDTLEKIIPAAVYLESIRLDSAKDAKVQLNIKALSWEALIRAYKVFFNYDSIIKNEVEVNGVFKASLDIKLRNDK